ncbi:UNVERIFIED_CONTAM: hypothetical protein HDU68_010873 [Siphonaria sp. JEL0065]|nr:hypothetical protein HDU68_010873 [Siphonaria sp. JEL0065]
MALTALQTQSQLVSVDLRHPPDSILSEWKSIGELQRWSDVLLSSSSWTTANVNKVRLGLAAPLSLTMNASRGGSVYEYAQGSLETFSVLEWLRRDLEDTPLDRLGLLSHSNQDRLTVNPGALTVAFEVGSCGNVIVNKLHLDLGGCSDWDRFSEPAIDLAAANNNIYVLDAALNPLMRTYNAWANKSDTASGFTACANACRDGVVRISDDWSLRDAMGVPTKLAIYSPSAISECSAIHLLSGSKFLGVPGPSASTLDKSTVWNDDRVALMVADPIYKTTQCFGNVDAALQDLPIKDRRYLQKVDPQGECEVALDKLDWKLFGKMYNEYILQGTETPSWPSFSKIFYAYIQSPPSPSTTWNNTLGGLPCSNWAKWSSLYPLKETAKIPLLNLQGPPIKTIHDLIHVALKMASSAPSSSTKSPFLSDSFLRDFSTICSKCRAVSDLSLYKIYKASSEVTNIACKASVLGGRGDRLSEFLTANRNELERVMLGLSSIASATLQVDPVSDTYQRYYYDYEDEYWQEIEASEKLEKTNNGVLGGLFGGKELSDCGRLVNISNEETVVYFDRCSSTTRLQFSIPITLLNLKYTVGKHNLSPNYILVSNNISIPYEEMNEYGDGSTIKSFDQTYEFDRFEEGSLFKFSSDGSHLEMDISFKRDFSGRVRLDVGFGFSKSSKMDEFSVDLICGYTPEIASMVVFPVIPVPLSNPLTDWVSSTINSESVMSAPIRYHVSTFNLESKSENTPYLIPQLAFLTAQSPLIALQNARHLGLNDANPLQLPSALKAKISLTDPCDVATVIGVPSGGRLAYRSDLMAVETCLEGTVALIEEALGACSSGGDGGSGGGFEVPVVSLVTSKKDKNQKVIVINVNWSPRSWNSHSRETKVLVYLMEHFRVVLGHPILVAGNFDDHVESVIRLGLDETGTWRNFFAPTKTGTVGSFVWAPTIPPADLKRNSQDVSLRHAPVASVTHVESCLAPLSNKTETGSCEALKEYGKQFRKAFGGVVAEDRLLAKHKACITDAGISEHLPVVYTISKADENISVVSFNIGGLSLSRIQRVLVQQPLLFPYLASFDVVLLQTTRIGSQQEQDLEEEYDSERVAEKLAHLFTEAFRNVTSNYGKTKIKKEEYQFIHSSHRLSDSHRRSGQNDAPATNLHIFVKDISPIKKSTLPKRLQMLNCTSEAYGLTSSILGCLFQVKESEYFIVSTLDDTIYSTAAATRRGYYDPMTSVLSTTGEDRASFIPPVVSGMLESPLTNPNVDLSIKDRGVMKRVYASLCMMRRRKQGDGGPDKGCSKYPIPAAFLGSWGWSREVQRDGRKGKVNGTWVEFRGVIDSVEKEIIRKNKEGDSKFPTGYNEKLRVKVIVPSERASRDYLRLLYGDVETASGTSSSTSSSSGSFGWFSGGKGEAQVQWPYWTDTSGHVSDYLVLWTSSSDKAPGEENADLEPEVPAYLAFVDPFLGSPMCEEKDIIGGVAACRTTAPACVPDRVFGAAGLRLDAGGRGGVGAAARRGWSLFGEENYNGGGGRFAAVCNSSTRDRDEL